MNKGFDSITSGIKNDNGDEFLFGYVDGERYAITNSPEQISAFIVKHRLKSVIITSILDVALIETSMGFIMNCADQEYLSSKLIPVLAPMQMGEVEAVEFIPHEMPEE